MSFSASATTLCASALASFGLRFPRFLPFGHPPSLPLAREALALRFELTLPSKEPMLMSFPQCGHFMP